MSCRPWEGNLRETGEQSESLGEYLQSTRANALEDQLEAQADSSPSGPACLNMSPVLVGQGIDTRRVHVVGKGLVAAVTVSEDQVVLMI